MIYTSISRVNIAMSLAITLLISIVGLAGAALTLFPIARFVLNPNSVSMIFCIAAVFSLAILLAVGTAGWQLNRHYVRLWKLSCKRYPYGMREYESFYRSYIEFSAVFAWFVCAPATAICMIAAMGHPHNFKWLILTGIMGFFSALGFWVLDRSR